MSRILDASPCRIALALLLGAPLLPMAASAQEERIVNGNFEGGVTACGADDECPDGWILEETRPNENSRILVVQDNGSSEAGTMSMDFLRFGGLSGDVSGIRQPLDLDLRCMDQAILSIDVKVLFHTLVAGGDASPAFEWPVRLQIRYVDTNGNNQIWRFGWYLANPGDGPRVDDPGSGIIPFYNDIEVPHDTWVANTFDLFAELPMVARITEIGIAGSGWSFKGRADNVSLLTTSATAFAGNVNAAAGPVQDVLFVNGSSGGATRTVTLAIREAINVTFWPAPAGPAMGDYVLYAYQGSETAPQVMDIGSSVLGCSAAATPFNPTGTQAFRCLRGGLPPTFAGTVRELNSPPSVPFSATKNSGFGFPASFLLQGVVRDAASLSPDQLSITNLVILEIR